MASDGERVVLVDPHAAHEKVIYQEILGRWDDSKLHPSNTGHTQLLLIPAMIECDRARMESFTSHAAWLQGCGFGLEQFGPTTLRCNAIPSEATAGDPAKLIYEILDSLDKDEAVTQERRWRVAALIACHSAVRFGDAIDSGEQQRLLARLAQTKDPLTCPHGRPTVMVLDDPALRRAFRRPVV